MTHAPTSSGPPHYTPTTCFCCGRRAHGIGLQGFNKGDPFWLCELCIPIMEQIRAARNFDIYEDRAIDAAIEGVGGLIGEYGADLSEWSESQRRQFVKEIILGFGDSVRAQVKANEVPF